MKSLRLALLFALGLPAQAGAAEFYVLDLGDGDAVVIEPAQITSTPDGNKLVDLDRVDGLINSVDITKVEIDCAGSRWNVISEILYGLDDRQATDKTSLNDKGWSSIPDGSKAKDFLDVICNWPNIPTNKDLEIEAADVWEMSKRTAQALVRMEQEDEQKKGDGN